MSEEVKKEAISEEVKDLKKAPELKAEIKEEKEEKESEGFSFDSSDIQRMEEHQKEKYKKTIDTLEEQIVELNKTIISLESKHKSAIKMYQDAMLEKMTLQLAYEKLEKQVEKQKQLEKEKEKEKQVEMSATEQVQDTLKKDACCVC
jgi:hypothetical protein